MEKSHVLINVQQQFMLPLNKAHCLGSFSPQFGLQYGFRNLNSFMQYLPQLVNIPVIIEQYVDVSHITNLCHVLLEYSMPPQSLIMSCLCSREASSCVGQSIELLKLVCQYSYSTYVSKSIILFHQILGLLLLPHLEKTIPI